MISPLVDYQLVILVLLWLGIILPHLWPRPSGGTVKSPTQSLKPQCRRSSEPTPFAGLTHKPFCPSCESVSGEQAGVRVPGPLSVCVIQQSYCSMVRQVIGVVKARLLLFGGIRGANDNWGTGQITGQLPSLARRMHAGPCAVYLSRTSSSGGNGCTGMVLIACSATRGPTPMSARKSMMGAYMTRSIVSC